MKKIVKWFKPIINWFKNLFKKKEKEENNPTPTPNPHPSTQDSGKEVIISTLTSWEDTKLFREFANENGITAQENVDGDEYNSQQPEETLKAIASELLFALEKGEEHYHNLRISKIAQLA